MSRRGTRKGGKKGAPIILIILFVGLICLGVAMLRGRGEASNGTHGQNADEVEHSGQHISGLDQVVGGNSSGSQQQEYKGYKLQFNAANHTPDWVAWELLANETDGGTKRQNNFWNDERVQGCAFHEDYKGSGYDRGHMCPAADMKWSPEAMNDCFSMANIVPQDNALNTGAWSTLEKKCRQWAQRDSALVIVAGPIYSESDKERIGSTGVRVPSAFYKVILAPYVAHPRAIGFVYPNMRAPGNMRDYSMTVDEVERLTGLDFFSALPDELENKVESVASFKEWNQ